MTKPIHKDDKNLVPVHCYGILITAVLLAIMVFACR